MASSSGGRRYLPLQVAVALVAFAAAFFRLPFLFSVTPSVSASYVFQFNNRIAVLVFIAGAALFAVYFRGLSLRPATRDSRVSRVSAFLAIAVCTGFAAITYWLSSPSGLQGEAPYFYGRLAQLAAGKSIYRDFEFAYGPLWLYLPLWTGRLLHLSLINGYFVFWIANWAVGIWLLYRIVNAIDIPTPHRTLIFFLFTIDLAGSILPQGINYAPVRTLITASLAMVMYAAHKRQYSLRSLVVVATACALVATGVSPEHGIAFMLGTGLFFLIGIRRRPHGYWSAVAAMAACFLTILFVCERTHVYSTLHAFSTGGYNYPIMPIPSVLCVLGLFVLAACAAYLAFQRGQSDSLTVYLLCICFFGLPSCFGRADSGHMQLGAFSALIIATMTLGRYRWASFLVIYLFFRWPATAPFAGQSTPLREQLERRLFDPARRSELPYRFTAFVLHRTHRDSHRQEIEAKVAQFYKDDTVSPPIPTGMIVNAPWNFLRDKFADTSGSVDYGYFFGPENVILPSQIDSIIGWLRSHPERSLILRYDWERYCTVFEEGEEPSLQSVYGYHWASPKKQMLVYQPLCAYINTHYAEDDVQFSHDNRLWHPVAR